MPTRDIPRDEWVAFFDTFSRLHDGWLSTIEVLGSGIGAQVETMEQALVGITADLKGSPDETISIFVGDRSDNNAGHIIHAPAHVTLKETDDGAHEALRIESQDGVTTLLRFRAPILPELLDDAVTGS